MIGLMVVGICIASSIAEKSNETYHAQVKARKTQEFGIDSASLHINKFNPSTPISWNVRLYRDGKPIFDTSATDNDIDQFFKDTLYVTGCVSYETCKSKWYLSEFKTFLIRTDYEKVLADPRIAEFATNKTVAQYQEMGLSNNEAKVRARKIVELIKQGKLDPFMPSWAPEGRNIFPKIFDARFNRFVEVNEW